MMPLGPSLPAEISPHVNKLMTKAELLANDLIEDPDDPQQ